MFKAIRIANKNGGTKTENNKMKKNGYRYCLNNYEENDDNIIEQGASHMVYKTIGDIAIFVSNCRSPRIKFIEEFVIKSPKVFVTHSFGKCYSNYKEKNNKQESTKMYHFLFAMENKMKKDLNIY